MGFVTLNYQAIRDGILRDIANQRPSANVAADGDFSIRANASGAAIEGLYQHQQWIVRQLFPDTSDSDYLEAHAGRRGLARKLPTPAAGAVMFGGSVGAVVPVGTESKTTSNVAYLTTATDVIGAGGAVTLVAQASAPGAAGNAATGTALTLTAAPSGILSTAAIVTMTGGTDVETDASLLSRLLFVLRNPPCGGAAHDYYTWAMQVSGVTAAYVYSNRRGLGTTDVVILTAGGLAGAALVAAAQTYIDTQRPVQADFLVFAPTGVPVNVTGTLTLAPGYTAAAVQGSINTAMAAYFATLKPGDTAYLNRIRAIVSDTAGVVDFALTSPTANVAAVVDATHTQMCVLGATSWT
jgi:uncharacterized phage protein gp47/JayE